MRHELLNAVRRGLNRSGFDLVRIDVSQPERSLPVLLEQLQVSVVLDVGANDGQYAATLRKNGFAGAIVSFEPTEVAFQKLRRAVDGDDGWECHQVALGPEDGEIDINVAGNDAASSSALAMLERHVASAPDSGYVATERVTQWTLDRALETVTTSADTTFLKLDVQGFESQVLAGGEKALDTLAGIQLEVSLQPLYQGSAHFLDLIGMLEAKGFMTVQILRGFHDDSELLQADFVLRRK